MYLLFLLMYIIYVYQCVVIYLWSITDNENNMIKINYITMIIKTLQHLFCRISLWRHWRYAAERCTAVNKLVDINA